MQMIQYFRSYEEETIYRERDDKTKFLQKNNWLNQFTKCVNLFRQQEDRLEKYEGWYDS
jgi:hypothetical protein